MPALQVDRWHRDSTWGYYDGNVDTLIMWPAHPPEGGQPARVRTQVTIDQPVGRADVTIVEYWAGGLRIIGSGSLTNLNEFHYYSRNDIETIGPDAYFYNAVPGTVYMYSYGGYSPIISGKLINQSQIYPDPASGTSGHIYNLFESANSSIYDLDFGTALYVGMPGGGTLAGSVQVEAGALFSFTNGGITELLASFSGTGQVNLGGNITVSGTVSIPNELNFGMTKLGPGTIVANGALHLGANIAEGTLVINGPCGFGGLTIGSSAIVINNNSLWQGYGVPHRSGVFLNNGTYTWDYDYNQYSEVCFENRGTFNKRGTAGAIFTNKFFNASTGHLNILSGWFQTYDASTPCLPTDSPTSFGGTIRIWPDGVLTLPRLVLAETPLITAGLSTVIHFPLSGVHRHKYLPEAGRLVHWR